jgi:nucleoside 2-deoxyribosyltransferase
MVNRFRAAFQSLIGIDHFLLKPLCREHGFIGIYPLDGDIPSLLSLNEQVRWIYTANVEGTVGAGMVLANLSDFRGPGEPDPGTAFKVGLAVALPKPVWAYRTVIGDLVEHVPSRAHSLGQVCAKRFLVEYFGMRVNLMLACSSTIVDDGPARCLSPMRSSFGRG